MRTNSQQRRAVFTLSMAAALLTAGCNQQQAAQPAPAAAGAPTLPAPNPEKNAYFGDLHLHTSMSFDAYAFGTKTLPEDSYRFAQGEPVQYLGQTVQRHAPLDFLAVTDHSEYLGVLRIAADANGPFAATEWPKLLTSTDPKVREGVFHRVAESFTADPRTPIKEFLTGDYRPVNWQHEIDAAEKYYKPGKFTTFAAYEWTAMVNSANLHRNVIFRGPNYPAQPFSSIDSWHPEDLWSYLDNNRVQGIDAIDIPHNSNVSDGLMFDYKDSFGTAITRSYAEARGRNEPVVEIAQAKGASETRPELSPTDEFSGFGIYSKLLGSSRQGKFDGSYVRQAYARGQEIESRVGVNPYKYGIIGASDFHSGISATEEGNFPGAHGLLDSQADAKKLLSPNDSSIGEPWVVVSAGALTGVWAEQNTRESIFDALRRKETFATSGVRLKVRLFAGWNYTADLLKKADWVPDAYAGGVPMGADLPAAAGAGKSPSFIVDAVKDPDSGNLDRIQIVKVWFKDGKSQEKVFDVVWAGDRKPDAKTGKLPEIGNTVDIANATYTNTIGATELSAVWTDPYFDAGASATYYARVLEIPTPRWTTYLAAKNKLPVPTIVPPTIQERAWTSPVFYKPV